MFCHYVVTLIKLKTVVAFSGIEEYCNLSGILVVDVYVKSLELLVKTLSSESPWDISSVRENLQNGTSNSIGQAEKKTVDKEFSCKCNTFFLLTWNINSNIK